AAAMSTKRSTRPATLSSPGMKRDREGIRHFASFADNMQSGFPLFRGREPMHRRNFVRLAAGALPSLALPLAAVAQDNYPAKPVTVVVSFSAGGNNDIRARQLGIEVTRLLGQSVIVDNKPG